MPVPLGMLASIHLTERLGMEEILLKDSFPRQKPSEKSYRKGCSGAPRPGRRSVRSQSDAFRRLRTSR